MLYKNESTKRKNMFLGKKTFFRGVSEVGFGFFSNFRGGGIDQEVGGGGLINIHFRGDIPMLGENVFSGGA